MCGNGRWWGFGSNSSCWCINSFCCRFLFCCFLFCRVLFFFKSCLRVWAEAEKTFEKLRGAYQMLTRRTRHKQFPLASNGVITVYIHGQKITQSFGVFRRETCETICIAALTDNLVLWKRQKWDYMVVETYVVHIMQSLSEFGWKMQPSMLDVSVNSDNIYTVCIYIYR